MFEFYYKFKKNILRKKYKKMVTRQCKSYAEPLKVNYPSFVNTNTILGQNIHLNGLRIAGQGQVIIGDNFHCGYDCLMITQVHNYDKGDAIPYGNDYIYKKIVIEDNVWLGDRVIILGDATVGEGAIIQAGSVVVKDIPKYALAGGHPAQVFKYRDINHYEKLKKEKKFH